MLDLRIGEPVFISEFWKSTKPIQIPDLCMSYKASRSHDELKEKIIELHKQVGNIDIENKHIIIGNGATQLIIGLLHILNKSVYLTRPYYYKFPDFIKIAGKKRAIGQWDWTTTLTAVPSNPNNLAQYISPISENILYDLCYYWPTYTNCEKVNPNIAVFSSAKALGNCSSRIGWAIIKDKDIADKLAEYVETSVGGISIEAKYKTIKMIDYVLQDKDFFTRLNLILKNRWDKIKQLSIKNFTVINDSGLYAWCKGKCPSSIIGIEGKSFGATNEYFRLNMGCSYNDFEKLLKELNSGTHSD